MGPADVAPFQHCERVHRLGDSYYQTASGLLLPSRAARRRFTQTGRPISVDLFSGVGGMSLGFLQAGWQVVAAADNDPDAAITYLMNLGAYPCDIHGIKPGDLERLDAAIEQHVRSEERGAKQDGRPCRVRVAGSCWSPRYGPVGIQHFFFGDIRKLSGRALLDALGLERGELDAVCGGPPCQGFSIGGKRQVLDPRNSLVFEFARLVLELQPKTMVLENVPGMMSMVTPEGLPVVDALCRILTDGGWSTYEAIKRSLTAMPNTRGALRRSAGGGEQIERRPRPHRQRRQPTGAISAQPLTAPSLWDGEVMAR